MTRKFLIKSNKKIRKREKSDKDLKKKSKISRKKKKENNINKGLTKYWTSQTRQIEL